MQLIHKYFPNLHTRQHEKFDKFLDILPRHNELINVVSRKDVDALEERHILHSLAIAKTISFIDGTTIIDVGTGGGLPGIPLAIMFPGSHFILVDSIGKKIRLVDEMIKALEINNVTTRQERMENLDITADFVVSRAVTSFSRLYEWSEKLIHPGNHNSLPNGSLSLKGGDLELELAPFRKRIEVYAISDWFTESFFSTKKIVYLKK